MIKRITLSALFALCALATMAAQCAGITRKGAQCRRNASPGSSYCWQHGGTTAAQRAVGLTDKDVVKMRCKATTKAGTQCKRMAGSGKEFCWQHESLVAQPAKGADKSKAVGSSNASVNKTETVNSSGKCQGITKKGRPCSRKVKQESNYCWQHQR